MAYCRNCGHNLGSGANFCPECGQDQSIVVPQDRRIPTEKVPVPPLPAASSRGGARASQSKRRVGLGAFLVAILLGLVVLGLAFGGGGEEQQTADAPPDPRPGDALRQTPILDPDDEEPVDVPAAPPEPAPEPEPEPITLSGVGPQATETFRLEDGLVVARMSHQGSSNFIVQPIDEAGASAGVTLANQIGTFEGSAATSATAGNYLLNVDADGPWTITLEQPRHQDAPATRDFSGAGMTATEPFSLNAGLARFEMSHQGESNFVVYLLDATTGGSVGAGLANEIGAVEGSQAVQVPKEGVYLLSVTADGPWTIEVS
ncbi:MAG: zinc ribbon domain-containing protein [Actinomycetota bacterium]|nr:zinc ribbon domain-containing protein [Actinomycetota bacterium]MDP9484758.1 zinc ribbon domain-containing protein [Actinomycetota bacterium]